jgi:hypothetical protein
MSQTGTRIVASLLLTAVLSGGDLPPAVAGGKTEDNDLLQTLLRHRQSQKNLKQIGRALHAHHEALGCFPAPAIHDAKFKPLLSWRVALLPFLGQDELFKRFKLDEPWDSPHNRKLLGEMPAAYAAPGVAASKQGQTYYQALVGKGAGFEPNTKLRFAYFADGTSNTMLIVEAATPVPWTKPEDVPVAEKDLPKMGGLFHGNFNALFADGAVHFISKDATPKELWAAMTRAGGEVLDQSKLFARPGAVGQVDPKRLPAENQRLQKAVNELLAKVANAKDELDVLKARLDTGNPEMDAQAVKLLRQNEQLRDAFVRAAEELARIQEEQERLAKTIRERSAKKK